MAPNWKNLKIIAHDGGELTRNDIRRLESLIRKAAMIKIQELEKKWNSIKQTLRKSITSIEPCNSSQQTENTTKKDNHKKTMIALTGELFVKYLKSLYILNGGPYRAFIEPAKLL